MIVNWQCMKEQLKLFQSSRYELPIWNPEITTVACLLVAKKLS